MGAISRKLASSKMSKLNESTKEIIKEPKTLDDETTVLELGELPSQNGIMVRGNHQPQNFLWLVISTEPFP